MHWRDRWEEIKSFVEKGTLEDPAAKRGGGGRVGITCCRPGLLLQQLPSLSPSCFVAHLFEHLDFGSLEREMTMGVVWKKKKKEKKRVSVGLGREKRTGVVLLLEESTNDGWWQVATGQATTTTTTIVSRKEIYCTCIVRKVWRK